MSPSDKLNETPKFELNPEEGQEQEKKLRRVGQLKPHRGHTIFKYNKKTNKLEKAKFEEDDERFPTELNQKGKRKIIMAEEDCIYVSALNVKNAVKRLAKYHGIQIIFEKNVKRD